MCIVVCTESYIYNFPNGETKLLSINGSIGLRVGSTQNLLLHFQLAICDQACIQDVFKLYHKKSSGQWGEDKINWPDKTIVRLNTTRCKPATVGSSDRFLSCVYVALCPIPVKLRKSCCS